MSFPEKKRKKTTTTTEEPLLNPTSVLPNMPLPQDLLLSCIAQLSRLHYPSLSLVSKSCRNLLDSPELYKTRSLLDRTETCLYVCLQFRQDPNPNPRWFTLCRRPPTKKKKPIGGNILVQITSPQTTPLESSCVAVGSEIYEIGGLINYVPSSNVSILDCRTNSWRKAPNMEVAKVNPFAIAIDGKILVKDDGLELGGSNDPKWTEVFDPKTQTWKIDSSKELEAPEHWRLSSSCVIDNVVYAQIYGEFKWFDNKVKEWRILKGLKGLPKCLLGSNTSGYVHLADYGGKMVLLWDRHYRASKRKERKISCAVIALERCSSEEISGTVEWSDSVLIVPKRFAILNVVAATV